MKEYRAVVLLSAYGRSPYIGEQVKSITSQLTEDDLLVVVDDGSKIVSWEEVISSKPLNYIFFSRLKNMGTKFSFLDLLLDYNFRGYYYFFADQDDVWYQNKIETQIKSMSTNFSWSFHSVDLISADGSHIGILHPIEPLSRIHYFFEVPQAGMTFCIDRHCIDILRKYKSFFAKNNLLHDHVVSAILLLYTKPVILKNTLSAYRLHGNNQTGIRDKHWLSRLKNINLREIRQIFEKFEDIYKFYNSVIQLNSDISSLDPFRSRIRSRLFDEMIFKAGYLYYYSTKRLIKSLLRYFSSNTGG